VLSKSPAQQVTFNIFMTAIYADGGIYCRKKIDEKLTHNTIE